LRHSRRVQSPTSLEKKTVINIHPDWISPDTMMKNHSSRVTRQTGSRRIDGLSTRNNAMLADGAQARAGLQPATNTWSNALSAQRGNLT